LTTSCAPQAVRNVPLADLAFDGEPVPQDMELFSGLASLPVRSHGRH
jgi:hypothetical protein